ncbi:uncharacterized protein LOC133886331 [Phragmites australis]|uniref:uncharacterized protein LOC133886331 n=1 Tax=Phragmites australis TaxID=29695 RepID=UPI002D779205|nr:uncharacterized protein LOC133886331 [Phragmites australis]
MLIARKYNSYTINGFKFHTQSYDERRPVQSSGVALLAETTCFERGNKDSFITGNKTYYGIIKEIIELDYHHKGYVVVFKCDWVDNRVQDKWVKTDQFGVTTVNFKHLFNTVVQSKPRDMYDMDDIAENENLNNNHFVELPDLRSNVTVNVVASDVPCVRTDIDGGKMPSAARNGNDSLPAEYDKQRLANIAANKRRLAALDIPSMNTSVQQCQPNKKAKKNQWASDVARERPNLRPRPQRNSQEEQGCEEGANEELTAPNLNDGIQDKRNGRGITRKENIFSRTPDMPKLKIELNDYGQPVGENSKQFASVVGCQVRKKLPLGCDDWRLVDPEKKYELWTDLQTFYDLDDSAFNWVIATASTKWKEYKSTLKELYFDPTLTDDELLSRCDTRVNDDDWKYLIDYWRSPEHEARTLIAKANRAKLKLTHTSGSKSYARSGHELSATLGRPPRRDEVFIKTHTHKNGVPSSQAAPIIE